MDSSLSGSEREETYAALAGLAKTVNIWRQTALNSIWKLGDNHDDFGVIGYAFLIILGAIGIMNLIIR